LIEEFIVEIEGPAKNCDVTKNRLHPTIFFPVKRIYGLCYGLQGGRKTQTVR
jgi:hypothetical protein